MGKPEAYVIDGDVNSTLHGFDENSVDNRREAPRRPSASRGPEVLSIVRVGDDDVHWIVVSMSADRRTASIAPLNQTGKVGMKHDVSLSKLWPYYGQADEAEQSESA
jgi:hypothetical protein